MHDDARVRVAGGADDGAPKIGKREQGHGRYSNEDSVAERHRKVATQRPKLRREGRSRDAKAAELATTRREGEEETSHHSSA